jgi:imidazolonepropionase
MSAPATTYDLAVVNARIYTCAGDESDRSKVIDGSIGIAGGTIAHLGARVSAARVIDAHGRAVVPGFVDAHTHLVFAGSRIDEFARKMAGEDYRAIAASGGGIASTVRATRAASDDALFELARARALRMRRGGTTAVEVKSGYGLSPEHELRLLRIARRLQEEGIVRTSPSYLGAHSIPPEKRGDRASYVAEVLDTLARVAGEKLADACDVYIDDGAFTLDEGRAILTRARELGLKLRAHVGQFADLGGAELVAELGGLSADHLEAVSDLGIEAMREGGTVAVFLPAAWSTLRQDAPRAERFRTRQVPIAIASDCNPGTSPATDLSLCAALAVRDAGLTLEEALLGVTAHAAVAFGDARLGRIALGAPADLSILPSRDARIVGYAMGGVIPDVVILDGRVVEEAPSAAPDLW